MFLVPIALFSIPENVLALHATQLLPMTCHAYLTQSVVFVQPTTFQHL